MSTNKGALDLTACPITSGLLRFSLPFLASSVLQTLYSTVDTIIVGQFVGSAGLAAVNNVSYICNAASNIGLGASAGGAVLIAQYCGAKNDEGIHRTVGTSLSISTIMAVIITLLVCLFIQPILNLIHIPEEARSEAFGYLMIRASCFLISFGYHSITSFLRGMGDSKRPLYFSAVASVANVILDLLLVAVIPWGAAGAALATEISELFALVWAFLYLKKHQPGMLTLNPRQYRIHRPTAKMVLKIGVPSSFQYLFIDLSFVFVNSIINGYGVIAASAVAVGSKVVNLSQVGISALSTGVGTMCGQNIGAGKPDRAGQTIRVGVRCALTVAVVMFCIIQGDPRAAGEALQPGSRGTGGIDPLPAVSEHDGISLCVLLHLCGDLHGSGLHHVLHVLPCARRRGGPGGAEPAADAGVRNGTDGGLSGHGIGADPVRRYCRHLLLQRKTAGAKAAGI